MEQVDIRQTLFPVATKEVPGVNVGGSPYRYVYRQDNDEILSIMTEDYQLIPNQLIADEVLPKVKDRGGIITETRIFGNGRRTFYKIHFPDIEYRICDEAHQPYVIIHNSYDGTKQLSMIGGLYRFICSNGMIIGVTMEKYNYRHIISGSGESLSNFPTLVDDVLKHISTEGPKIEALSNTRFDRNKHIPDVYNFFPNTVYDELYKNFTTNKQLNNYYDLLQVYTNILTHKVDRNIEAVHDLENRVYSEVSRLETAARKVAA